MHPFVLAELAHQRHVELVEAATTHRARAVRGRPRNQVYGTAVRRLARLVPARPLASSSLTSRSAAPAACCA